ncbi:MAG TPA: glycosyltransferase [Alkalispirochaeta sp.]|nr:glycosyltransferase [Alkalispirochaeta sp.]
MKIGVMVGRFPVVSEQFILNHIVGLIDSGHEVTILAVNEGDIDRVQPMVRDYQLMEQTVFARLPRSPRARFVGVPLMFLWNLIRRPIPTFIGIRYGRYRTGVTSGKTMFFLNAVGSLRFDLLHVHFGANGLTGAFLKDIGVADRLAVAFHGSDINTYPRRYGQDVYHYMYSRCDLITANTSFTADKIVANGADRSRIRLVPESLKVGEYPFVERDPKENRFRILTVGRLVDKKGHRYVLPAIAAIRDRIPGLSYRMVGDGPNRPALEAQARELGVDDICEFAGLMTSDAIQHEYAKCDLFVLASVTAPSGDMEGQGLVLQEAQASGCPVVSTLHNGIPDGVLDGETGLLVPEGDSQALAEAILRLAEDRERLKEMGRRGSQFVTDKYDTQVVTRTLQGWYHELIGMDA